MEFITCVGFTFVACKDEYDVNLDELYGTTTGSSSKVDKEIITCGDSKVMIINIGKASMTTVPYEWEWDSKQQTIFRLR